MSTVGRRYSTSSEVNEVVREQVNKGWIFQLGKKHHKLFFPGSTQHFVSIPITPSDNRSVKNLKRDIRHVERRVEQ